MRSSVFQIVEKQEAWTTHLRDVFESLDIPSGTMADNLSESVAMYCRKFHPHGVQAADLKLLIARAFCSVGDRAAAECVLQSMDSHGRHSSRWLEILSELHHFPELLPYFSMGIIRPADWAGAQVDRMWIFDFGRLSFSDAEKHEMMLYRSIRVVVEKTAVFWDATEGEGIFGLKNLDSLALEKKGRKNKTLSATDDLLEYITDLFRQLSVERKWATVPSLLNLAS